RSLLLSCRDTPTTPLSTLSLHDALPISATAGGGQSTKVGATFGANLQATVTESGNPVAGATVTFTAPASGASGSFSDSGNAVTRSEEHTSELQSLRHLVCRLLLEKKKKK